MARPVSSPRVLTLDSPILTGSAVAALTNQIAAAGEQAEPWVLDCRKVREVDPWGLCALLELGRAFGGQHCILAALTPALLAAAIESGLACYFTICRDVDAALALLRCEQDQACGQ